MIAVVGMCVCTESESGCRSWSGAGPAASPPARSRRRAPPRRSARRPGELRSGGAGRRAGIGASAVLAAGSTGGRGSGQPSERGCPCSVHEWRGREPAQARAPAVSRVRRPRRPQPSTPSSRSTCTPGWRKHGAWTPSSPTRWPPGWRSSSCGVANGCGRPSCGAGGWPPEDRRPRDAAARRRRPGTAPGLRPGARRRHGRIAGTPRRARRARGLRPHAPGGPHARFRRVLLRHRRGAHRGPRTGVGRRPAHRDGARLPLRRPAVPGVAGDAGRDGRRAVPGHAGPGDGLLRPRTGQDHRDAQERVLHRGTAARPRRVPDGGERRCPGRAAVRRTVRGARLPAARRPAGRLRRPRRHGETRGRGPAVTQAHLPPGGRAPPRRRDGRHRGTGGARPGGLRRGHGRPHARRSGTHGRPGGGRGGDHRTLRASLRHFADTGADPRARREFAALVARAVGAVPNGEGA